MRRRRWLALAAGLAALALTWANRGERMVLHLGLFTWYRAPVAPVILGAILVGMALLVLATPDRPPPPASLD